MTVCGPIAITSILPGFPAGSDGDALPFIDPGRVASERRTLDVVGHYARNDVFQLTIDRTRQIPLAEAR